jgi:hypothetical protein
MPTMSPLSALLFSIFAASSSIQIDSIPITCTSLPTQRTFPPKMNDLFFLRADNCRFITLKDPYDQKFKDVKCFSQDSNYKAQIGSTSEIFNAKEFIYFPISLNGTKKYWKKEFYLRLYNDSITYKTSTFSYKNGKCTVDTSQIELSGYLLQQTQNGYFHNSTFCSYSQGNIRLPEVPFLGWSENGHATFVSENGWIYQCKKNHFHKKKRLFNKPFFICKEYSRERIIGSDSIYKYWGCIRFEAPNMKSPYYCNTETSLDSFFVKDDSQIIPYYND